MASPTSRTLAEMRKRGYLVFVVERFNHFAKVRQDFAGFADLLAYRGGEQGVTAIQTTTGDNLSARIKKCQESANAKEWLQAGNRLLLHGWRLIGQAGTRKTYQVRELSLVINGNKIEPLGPTLV